MKYLSIDDDEPKKKLGIRLVMKSNRKLTQFLHFAAPSRQRFEWVNDCKGFKKLFFDKLDFRNPVCLVNCKQIFNQNCKTLEVLKFQNVMGDPEGISHLKDYIISCKNLKDLEVIWNIKYFDDEPARSFKYTMFDIMDTFH